jgi:hypothetical protein
MQLIEARELNGTPKRSRRSSIPHNPDFSATSMELETLSTDQLAEHEAMKKEGR